MSNPGEVIRKADALLGRYGRPARAESQAEYPVLTEVVEIHAPVAQNDDVPAAESQDYARNAAAEAALLRELEDRIVNEVQSAVASRLTEVLGEPLRERLEAYLNAAVGAVSGQIRSDLEAMVKAAVSDAIAKVTGNNPDSGSSSLR